MQIHSEIVKLETKIYQDQYFQEDQHFQKIVPGNKNIIRTNIFKRDTKNRTKIFIEKLVQGPKFSGPKFQGQSKLYHLPSVIWIRLKLFLNQGKSCHVNNLVTSMHILEYRAFAYP